MKVALVGASGFVASAILKQALERGHTVTATRLVDAGGKNWISVQDFVVAMIDELERPAHVRQRFTAG